MNNNDYREITEDDVTTVSTDQKEEMNRQESVNDTLTCQKMKRRPCRRK